MRARAKVSNSYNHFRDLGIQVINSSFASTLQQQINQNVTLYYDSCEDYPGPNDFCDAISVLTERGILISASSGNGSDSNNRNNSVGFNSVDFPASDSRTIAVGAVTIFGNKAGFSNYGTELDLVAPDWNILSTIQEVLTHSEGYYCGDKFLIGSTSDDGYGHCSGTSMSAPFITGILGLMRSADPLLTGDNIKDALFKSSSNFFTPTLELGKGIPDAALAVDNVLGTVNGVILKNRLTPLFSFYSWAAKDSFYTSVPQMGCPAMKGTLLTNPLSTLNTSYYPWYGSQTIGYNAFPHGPYECNAQPTAEVYIFTTKKNILNPSQPLVPLYRLSYQGHYGNNPSNIDHVYTTEQAGINAYKNLGYKLDGIEGYIYSNQYPQPINTQKLYRMYNSAKDDHALFPQSQYSAMYAQGYTLVDGGNPFIGYVHINIDSDLDGLIDGLIDGFESIAGTCVNNSDSDNDGISDGIELNAYPRTDPLSTSIPCDSFNGVPDYPMQQSIIGTNFYNNNWHYAMGYHFTPSVNGIVAKLGGLFSGTKQVKLFKKSTGQLLSQITVTNTNDGWSYSDVPPVFVQAGETYTVAVYLTGTGGSYNYWGNNYPLSTGNITIEGTTYINTITNSNAIPTNTATNAMYGMADIYFTPELPD